MKNMPAARKPFINQLIAAAASNGTRLPCSRTFSRCVNYRHASIIAATFRYTRAENRALSRALSRTAYYRGDEWIRARARARASHAYACARMNEWDVRISASASRGPRPATHAECAMCIACRNKIHDGHSFRFVSHASLNCRAFFARIIQI